MSRNVKVAFTLVFTALFVLGVVHHNEDWLFLAGTVMLGLVGAVITAFVIVYSQRPWKSTATGRALMYSNIGLALICDLTILVRLIGTDWEWWGLLRLILFTAVLMGQSLMLYRLLSQTHPQEVENDGSEGA